MSMSVPTNTHTHTFRMYPKQHWKNPKYAVDVMTIIVIAVVVAAAADEDTFV